MNTSWMKARQTKFTLYTTVYILIVVAVVSGVNFLANRYNKSYDSTANKQFTLSDQTVKVAKGLQRNVTISYWDQPSKFESARDLLSRYRNLSPKIDVQYQDTDKKRTQAIAAGVKTLGTVFVEVGNNRQEAKALTEEDITGAMIRALKGGERTVCFVTGSGEHSLTDTDRTGYSALKDLLEKNNYKTDSIKLIEQPEVPKNCTVLVAGGPRRDYIPPEVDAIKSYVENGGRALIMVDPPLKFARQETDDNQALVNVLSGWGVTPDRDLVLDTSGIGQLYQMGPEVPLISAYADHAITRDMKDEATGFPIARSLELKSGDKSTVEKLFATTDNSIATLNLKSAEVNANKPDKKGSMVLAAAGTFNAGKDSGNGRFVVVGCSNWVANFFLGFNGNRDLFLNMMNWLSSDEDLISIRPKEPQDRRLNMSARQMTLVFYESVLMIPLAIVVIGVGVWWRRR